MIPRPPFNIRSKSKSSASQGLVTVTKCIMSRRDSCEAQPQSRCGCVVAQRDGAARPSRRATSQPCWTVLLKAIEWSASVMHSLECPASSQGRRQVKQCGVDTHGESGGRMRHGVELLHTSQAVQFQTVFLLIYSIVHAIMVDTFSFLTDVSQIPGI